MKKRISVLLPLLVVWGILAACSFSNMVTPAATPTPYVITATFVPSEVQTNVEVSPVPSENTSEPQAAQPTAAQEQPAVLGAVSNTPLGILVTGNVDGVSDVYDLAGNQLGSISTPGLSYSGNIHVYGLTGNDINTVQAIFYSYDGNRIRRFANGSVSDLGVVQNFANMQGAEGLPYILVATGRFDAGGLATNLSAYDFSNGIQSRNYMDIISAESHVLSPMKIMSSIGVPSGAYYTNEAYGIGGDIVYPVTYGLYYLDLPTGNVHWLFNDEYIPLSISPDGTMAAIIHRDASGLGGVSVYELSGPSEIVTYDLLMGQDRGAGYGVISPNNQKVAFMQAGGYMMAEVPDFHSMLCYADIAAGAVANCVPATDLVNSGVQYPNSTAQPLGWLNDHEVVYEASTFQEIDHHIRVLDVTNGTVRDLATGRFLGFIY